MRDADVSIFVHEGPEGLEIGRSDGLGICKEAQVLLHILKQGRLRKGKLQFLPVQKVKDDDLTPPGTELFQTFYDLFGFIEKIRDQNDQSPSFQRGSKVLEHGGRRGFSLRPCIFQRFQNGEEIVAELSWEESSFQFCWRR